MNHRTEPVEHFGAAHFRPGQTLLYRDPIWNRDVVVEFRAKEGYLALVCSRDKLHRVPADWLRNWERKTSDGRTRSDSDVVTRTGLISG